MARSLCLSLALLFLANVISSKAQSEAPAAGEAARAGAAGDAAEVVFEVRLKANISLLCNLPNENGREFIWKKNGTAVEEVADLKGRYKLEAGGARLTVARGLEDDAGNYSCALPGAGEQRWAVRGNPYAKLPPNSNVVEGQKLKLVCKVTGKPYPRVTWWYTNSSDWFANYTEVREALGERATLERSEQGVPDGVLLLAAAARSDAGRYNCTPGAGQTDQTVLRVKDMYAALWPFLGICAEVFILCAIILVYEKRRTKPELDDSDTDNHDQKKS